MGSHRKGGRPPPKRGATKKAASRHQNGKPLRRREAATNMGGHGKAGNRHQRTMCFLFRVDELYVVQRQ